MFIIWGKLVKERKDGVIAGRCPKCGTIGLLDLFHQRHVPHVYFIPIGGAGAVVSVSTICRECGGVAHWTPDTFRHFVRDEDADEMTLQEILDETNPTVADELALQLQVERELRADASRRGDGIRPADATSPLAPMPPRTDIAPSEAQRAYAAVQLSQFVNTSDVKELTKRLKRWSTLDPAEQHRLLGDITSYIAAEDRMAAVDRLLLRTSRKLDGILPALLAYALAIGGCAIPTALLTFWWASTHIRKTDGRDGVVVAASVVACLVPAAIVALIDKFHWARRRRKAIIREEMLAGPAARSIDFGELLRRFDDSKGSRKNLGPGARMFLPHLPLLNEVLRETEASVRAEPAAADR
jgi:hypothetical protein